MQTLGDNLSRLDSEIYRILTSNEFRDDHEKSKNYLQILRRHFKNSSFREPVIGKNEIQDDPLDEENFVPEYEYKEKKDEKEKNKKKQDPEENQELL